MTYEYKRGDIVPKSLPFSKDYRIANRGRIEKNTIIKMNGHSYEVRSIKKVEIKGDVVTVQGKCVLINQNQGETL